MMKQIFTLEMLVSLFRKWLFKDVPPFKPLVGGFGVRWWDFHLTRNLRTEIYEIGKWGDLDLKKHIQEVRSVLLLFFPPEKKCLKKTPVHYRSFFFVVRKNRGNVVVGERYGLDRLTPPRASRKVLIRDSGSLKIWSFKTALCFWDAVLTVDMWRWMEDSLRQERFMSSRITGKGDNPTKNI